MTSKESLFNKGVFLTVLRRFRLGSLLYFIVLFLCVPTVFLAQNPQMLERRYFASGYSSFFDSNSVIFNSGMMIFPVIVSFFVATVVALLVYNFIHSSRHAIFSHSLPVNRKANFISTLCGAFTLMALPIILNGVILIIMSLCGYGKVIGIVPSIVWVLILLSIVFIMFSFASISAFLTGNSFSLVAINVILLLLPVAFAGAVSLLGDMFLYGFTDNNDVFEKIILASPLIWIVDKIAGSDAYTFFKNSGVWVFMGIAVIFYILSYFFYKKRRVELCGDVAGFHIMRPILKYTVCTVGFIISLGIFSSMKMHPFFYYLLTTLVTSIIYFACEMVLKKNLRVFGFYKGLIAFFAGIAIVLSFTAFTSVCGFETRIPDSSDVESVALYTHYNFDIPYVEDDMLIKKAISLHEDMLTDIPIVKDIYLNKEEPVIVDTADSYTKYDTSYNSNIVFRYKLKNGKILSRAYSIDQKTKNEIMSSLFENTEYKKKVTGISRLNFDNINQLTLDTHLGGTSYSVVLNERAPEFFRALEKDISEMTYEEFNSNYPLSININFGMDYEENLKSQIFKPQIIDGVENKNVYFHFDASIRPTFKNAIKFLRDNGYIDELRGFYAKNFCISTVPVYYDGKLFSFNGQEYDLNMRIPISEGYLRRLSIDEGEKFFEDVFDEKIAEGEKPYAENYYVFCANSTDYKGAFLAANYIKRYSPQNIPEYLMD